MRVPLLVDDGVAGGGQDFGASGGVMAESLDGQHRRLAVLPIFCRQAGWSAVCPGRVQGVVDGGFGAQGPSLLVALLDLGVLVEQVQARGDPASNDASGEGARAWFLRSR